jgi:hypothetical protein
MSSNLFFTVGTTKKWKSSGGDAVITFTSVTNAAGRLGGQLDLGDLLAANTAARAGWYRWYAKTKCQATGLVIGNTIDLYWAGWNVDASGAATDPDGNVGASDAAFATAALLNNLKLAGSVVVDSLAGSTVLAKSGIVFLPYRYVSPVLWNGSGATASATATDTEIWLTPFNPQAQ